MRSIFILQTDNDLTTNILNTMTGKNVFLFLTDKASDTVLHHFKVLQEGVKELGKAYVLFHQKEDEIPAVYKNPESFLFTNKSLGEMGYLPIGNNLVPGNNHFPLFKFFRKHPHFDYYWLIEDDVWFNGDWSYFFSFFQAFDHPFISSHLRTYAEEPQWSWWRSLLHPIATIPREKRVRSFNPVYRLSKNAIEFLHRSLSDFWIGHHEVLLPTLLINNGFSVADFGGHGNFVVKGNENRFYTSEGISAEGRLSEGTMRFRPAWNACEMKENMLYHPVKGPAIITRN